MSFHIIIPARYASSRLPGKPLLPIGDKPMIQHVFERATGCGAQSVVVATDDLRIADVAKGFGAQVCMTSPEHQSGTDRLAETVAQLGLPDDAVVVNLQGDEPLVPPELLHQVAELLEQNPEADLATLSTRIHTAAELFDPHVVKVITDSRGRALYFSRAVIPWDRDAFAVTTEELPDSAVHYRHLGIYAYRVGYLKRYVSLESCELERMESLEQLRVMWHGGTIQVAEAKSLPGHGVDTEADLERVRRLFVSDR